MSNHGAEMHQVREAPETFAVYPVLYLSYADVSGAVAEGVARSQDDEECP